MSALVRRLLKLLPPEEHESFQKSFKNLGGNSEQDEDNVVLAVLAFMSVCERPEKQVNWTPRVLSHASLTVPRFLERTAKVLEARSLLAKSPLDAIVKIRNSYMLMCWLFIKLKEFVNDLFVEGQEAKSSVREKVVETAWLFFLCAQFVKKSTDTHAVAVAFMASVDICLRHVLMQSRKSSSPVVKVNGNSTVLAKIEKKDIISYVDLCCSLCGAAEANMTEVLQEEAIIIKGFQESSTLSKLVSIGAVEGGDSMPLCNDFFESINDADPLAYEAGQLNESYELLSAEGFGQIGGSFATDMRQLMKESSESLQMTASQFSANLGQNDMLLSPAARVTNVVTPIRPRPNDLFSPRPPMSGSPFHPPNIASPVLSAAARSVRGKSLSLGTEELNRQAPRSPRLSREPPEVAQTPARPQQPAKVSDTPLKRHFAGTQWVKWRLQDVTMERSLKSIERILSDVTTSDHASSTTDFVRTFLSQAFEKLKPEWETVAEGVTRHNTICLLSLSALDSLVNFENQRAEPGSSSNSLVSVLTDESFLMAVVCVCANLVASIYGMVLPSDESHSDHEQVDSTLSFLFRTLDVQPYSFLRVTSCLVRSERARTESNGIFTFPVRVHQHLVVAEEMVAEWFVWQRDSEQILSGLNLYFSRFTSTTEALENAFNCVTANEAAKNACKQVDARKTISELRSIIFFLRRFSSLEYQIIKRLGGYMELSRTVQDKVWTLFAHILASPSREIMRGRHAHQMVLCAFYSVLKMTDKATPFRNLIFKYYKCIDSAKKPIIVRKVLLSHETDGPKYGDIITFYNTVYLPAVQDLVLLICGGDDDQAAKRQKGEGGEVVHRSAPPPDPFSVQVGNVEVTQANPIALRDSPVPQRDGTSTTASAKWGDSEVEHGGVLRRRRKR
mmetsp:Transcript_11171/g.29391  ORF Transcript_11171/g.29391 Transcript_11171/m.29391 type:complete len:901 (+) Transcript_11171:102-2804(+)